MKKFLLFLLLLLIPISSKAYYCDYDDYNEFRKKASNVNLMVDYEIILDEARFTITLYNIKEEQYIYDVKNDKTYYYDGNDSIEIVVTKPGSYSFEVYSEDNYCDNNYLNKLFVEIPIYNPFYKDDLCIGIENYKYCQRWFSKKLDYSEFVDSVTQYKESLKVEEIIVEDDYKSIFDYMLEFYLKYWFIILPAIIVVCSIFIVILRKKENKFVS